MPSNKNRWISLRISYRRLVKCEQMDSMCACMEHIQCKREVCSWIWQCVEHYIYVSTQAETRSNYCANAASTICTHTFSFAYYYRLYLASFPFAMVVSQNAVWIEIQMKLRVPLLRKKSFYFRVGTTEQCRISWSSYSNYYFCEIPCERAHKFQL